MKKPVLIFFGILLLAFISVYFIIPQKIKTTNVIEIDATDVNVSKFLVNKRPWAKWWPGEHTVTDSSNYTFKGVKYKLTDNTIGDIKALIKFDGIKLNSLLSYASTGEGMCEVTWTAETISSLNPVTRVIEFVKIKRLTKDFDTALLHFKKFMQTDTNVYGMRITIARIKDPIVLATVTHVTAYPKAQLIYQLANSLKSQIKAQGALPLDSPMLNFNPDETGGYQLRLAIAVNKLIKPGANTQINNLVKGGNMLATEVKGGEHTIANAFAQLKRYQKDHHLVSPAMPYESLVTNRLAEPDSAKWVTKIFWPVF